jgi:hypothetical protein
MKLLHIVTYMSDNRRGVALLIGFIELLELATTSQDYDITES